MSNKIDNTKTNDNNTIENIIKDSDGFYLPCLSNADMKKAEWLIDGLVPRRGITAIVGDGGCGKSSICCQLAANISNGIFCLLSQDVQESISNESNRVLYFTGEDSVEYTLKRRLVDYGANENNIFYMDVTMEEIGNVRFDSNVLKDTIRKYKPSLVILDPIQAFVPQNIKMSSRNDMRKYIGHLNHIAAEKNCSILLVVHTNKREGASGRMRMSDSSDIWDICRSVLMLGDTDVDGIRYISHEKNNLGERAKTILYSIEDGKIVSKGTTEKKDRDFVSSRHRGRCVSVQQDEARLFIMDYLSDCLPKEVGEVDKAALASGCSKNAIQKIKRTLKNEGLIEYSNTGAGKSKHHYMKLVADLK